MSQLRAALRHNRKQGFEFPGPSDRVSINGKTGSGKSVFAFWLFSQAADFDKKPWVIIDYKGERIASAMLDVRDAELVKTDAAPPTKPGIYVLRPEPHQQMMVAAFMWEVYKRGKTGLIFDELSMVPEFKGEAGSGGPLKAILTQGRSKEIPVYGLTQRPVDVNLHMFSEAEFISLFRMKSKDDRKRILSYLPDDNPIFQNERVLPPHWSKWYDDKRDYAIILKPCPPAKEILDTIALRVHQMRQTQKL